MIEPFSARRRQRFFTHLCFPFPSHAIHISIFQDLLITTQKAKSQFCHSGRREHRRDIQSIQASNLTNRREAYVTVLHSSEAYVCDAIALAQSILATGTKRDLVMLLDKSISKPKRDALAAAGWKLRFIKQIRNPRAEKNSYNEYNYSKFRLWQLTDYDKIIFIDSDIVVLRNTDILFQSPQMSATGNDVSIFNSGTMAIEPSKCTFKALMDLRKEIVSYNGGDQGFLNEVFVWWHRWPRRVNFLKNFWANTTLESSMKNQLFGADPPMLYSIPLSFLFFLLLLLLLSAMAGLLLLHWRERERSRNWITRDIGFLV